MRADHSSSKPPPFLSVESVSKAYDEYFALDNVDLSMSRGERVALLGANGAGKSTLFRLLLGLSEPDEGRVSIDGQDPLKLTPLQRGGLAFLPETTGLPSFAPIEMIARLFRSLYEHWQEERLRALLDAWEIDARKPVGSLSKGEGRLAELALTLARNPTLLILDEPLTGLDALVRWRVLRELASLPSDVTILYSTHILEDVPKLARRVVILRNGRKHKDATLASLSGSVSEAFAAVYEESAS